MIGYKHGPSDSHSQTFKYFHMYHMYFIVVRGEQLQLVVNCVWEALRGVPSLPSENVNFAQRL